MIDARDRNRTRRSVALFLVALPVLWGFYLLLVYPPSMVELPIGVGAAALAALTLAIAYRVLWPGYQLPPQLMTTAARLPLDVLRDLGILTALLTAAIARRHPLSGASRWVPVPKSSNEAAARGRRVATEVLATVASNTVAVGFDKSGRRMLLHEMRPADVPPSGEAAS